MAILVREIDSGSDGGARDQVFDVDTLTLGSANDQDLQLVGRGILANHATLQAKAGKISLRCVAGVTVEVNGESVKRATLNPGDVMELAGHQLRMIDPPSGFEAAFELELNLEIDPSFFEAAFTTSLEQTWLGKRGPAWLLTIAVVAIGLAVPYFVTWDGLPWWTSDESWSSGPLHPAHTVAIGDDCSTCHVKAFERVQDATCTTCHTAIANHAPMALHTEVGLADIRCATCHKEHNEPGHLTVTADTLCTDCHTNPDWPSNQLATVSGFQKDSHPNFAADLLVASSTQRGTGLVFDWQIESTPLAEAVNQANLIFPHDIHLDAETTGEALECTSCHTLSADDEHFETISMEQHCRSCHDLKFDRQAPDRELPHGDPSEVILALEGHFLRTYTNPDRQTTTRTRRRLPGSDQTSEQCDAEAYVCAQQRTADEAANQFTRRGCVLCHEVYENTSTDLLTRYQVLPVRLTEDFYSIAQFDHRAHLTQEGASGDDACLSCHNANASNASTDLLIPDLEQCTTCHDDHRTANLIPLHCAQCHSFHPRDQRMAAPEVALGLSTGRVDSSTGRLVLPSGSPDLSARLDLSSERGKSK